MGRRAGRGEGSWKGREHSVRREALWGAGLGAGPVFCPPLFFVSFLNFFILIFGFWSLCMTCGILIPRPGIPALEVQRLYHPGKYLSPYFDVFLGHNLDWSGSLSASLCEAPDSASSEGTTWQRGCAGWGDGVT